jgi:hypothetical protein
VHWDWDWDCAPKRVDSTSTDQQRPRQKVFRSCKRTASAPHFRVGIRNWDLFREKVRLIHDRNVIAFRLQGVQDKLLDGLPRPSEKIGKVTKSCVQARRCFRQAKMQNCSPWSSMTLHAHEKKARQDHSARTHPVSQRKARTKIANAVGRWDFLQKTKSQRPSTGWTRGQHGCRHPSGLQPQGERLLELTKSFRCCQQPLQQMAWNNAELLM